MSTIIITRPVAAIKQTQVIYKEAGLKTFAAPSFAIHTNPTVTHDWLVLKADTWLILSVHALKHALKIAPHLKPNKDTRVIAVGPAVKKLWLQHFDHPIKSHKWMNSEGVIALLKRHRPESVKILTTLDGRSLIRQYCSQQCISYTQINTYLKSPLSLNTAAISALYDAAENANAVVMTATSQGILQHLHNQMDQALQTQVKQFPLVVGAERIGKLAKELGFINIHVAANPSDSAMCHGVKSII